MGFFSTIKQIYLFYKLEKAVKSLNLPKVEKYFLPFVAVSDEAIAINKEEGKIEIYDVLGMSCMMLRKLPEAKVYFLKELSLQEKNEKVSAEAIFYTHYSLGEVNYLVGDFKVAVVHYLHALNLFDKNDLPSFIDTEVLLRGLVNSYILQNLFKKAEPFARREIALREKLNNINFECLRDLGLICFESKKYVEAESFFLRALNLLDVLNLKEDTELQADIIECKEKILEHLIDCYMRIAQVEKGQTAFQKLKVLNPHTNFVLPSYKNKHPEKSSVDLSTEHKITPIKSVALTIKSNGLCHCGSGKKYKKCHGR